MAEGRVLVSCYSGRIYADRPVSLIWEGIEHKIEEVEKEWQEPGARLFKVRTENGRLFVLSYNERGDEWAAFELVKNK
jgi:hypothetical protein